MNIRECTICGKAIYGDDYFSSSGGYYHEKCVGARRAGIGGDGGGWQEGTLTFSADGVSFTPAEYKIYTLLKEVKSKLEGESE